MHAHAPPPTHTHTFEGSRTVIETVFPSSPCSSPMTDYETVALLTATDSGSGSFLCWWYDWQQLERRGPHQRRSRRRGWQGTAREDTQVKRVYITLVDVRHTR